MPKVTMIPATVNSLTHLPKASVQKGVLPDMPEFQLTVMSSSQAMKRRWTTTPDTFSQSRSGIS